MVRGGNAVGNGGRQVLKALVDCLKIPLHEVPLHEVECFRCLFEGCAERSEGGGDGAVPDPEGDIRP